MLTQLPWWADIAASGAVPLFGLCGYPFVRLWEIRSGTPLQPTTRLAAAFALALAFVQAGGMFLGFAHELRATWVVVWLVLGAAAAVVCATRVPLRLAGESKATAAWLPMGLLVLAVLLYATVPPWRRDEMVYHLALPRFFAVAQGYQVPDDNIFASFPLGWESILAAFHSLGAGPDHFAPFNPRLVGAWTSVAVALATAGLVSSAGVSKPWAILAATLLWTVPDFFQFGGSCYVEPYLILAATLCLTGLVRAWGGERACVTPAALFAALATSTKYPGLAVALFTFLLLLLLALRGDPRDRVREALRFGLVVALVGSPFYIRNAWQRGNPIFPFLYGALGGAGWDGTRQLGYGQTLADYGMGRSLLDWALLPWRLMTATDLQGPFEGALGPLPMVGALAGLAVVLSRLRKQLPAAAPLLLFSGAWFLFWGVTCQQTRFFLVAVPALMCLLMLGLSTAWQRSPAVGAALVGVLVLGAGTCVRPVVDAWQFQETSAWLSGQISRERLLSIMLPENAPYESELERLVPASGKVWLVWTRNYTYYFRRPYRLDCVFEGYRFEHLLENATTDATFRDALKAEGITHVLVNHRFFLRDDNADEAPGRTRVLEDRFRQLTEHGTLRPQLKWRETVLYEVT
jgi:hypothetical protein